MNLIEKRSLRAQIMDMLLWLMTAGLLGVLWASLWFAAIGGLDMLRHYYGDDCIFPGVVVDSEGFLRHWSSHLIVSILIIGISTIGIISNYYGRKVSKTMVIVLFLTFCNIGVFTIFGSAFSFLVPHKCPVFSP